MTTTTSTMCSSTTTTTTPKDSSSSSAPQQPAQSPHLLQVAIAGGGIVGLALALSLHKRLGHVMDITVYEKTKQFVDDVGAGMGLYPNGLRVLDDIDVLEDVQQAGTPYEFRRWTRHDGTTVAIAKETVLSKSHENGVSNQDWMTTALEKNKDNNGNLSDDGSRDSCDTADTTARKLQPLGIRRWKFQKCLYQAVLKTGIPVHFDKCIVQVEQQQGTNSGADADDDDSTTTTTNNNTYVLHMQDGTTATAHLVFAADGVKSCIREQVLTAYAKAKLAADQQNQTNNNNNHNGSKPKFYHPYFQQQPPAIVKKQKELHPKLQYTGTTCLMGIAEHTPQDVFGDDNNNNNNNNTKSRVKRRELLDWTKEHFKGICFPSSASTGCHAVFFPTGPTEQCFQFHFPLSKSQADPANWSTLTNSVGLQECTDLANKLRAEGWHEAYLQPLMNATNAVRIGFCLLEPKGIDHFAYSVNGRQDDGGIHNNNDSSTKKKNPKHIVLLGDAAHPPVPYIGQGSQMGLEDAGTLALLMEHYCLNNNENNNASFTFEHWDTVIRLYERMRIPRTTEILQNGKELVKRQQQETDGSTTTTTTTATSSSNDNDPISLRRAQRRRRAREEQTKRDVFFHETLPILFPGAQYDYRIAVESVLQQEREQEAKRLRQAQLQQQQQQQQQMPPLREEDEESQQQQHKAVDLDQKFKSNVQVTAG